MKHVQCSWSTYALIYSLTLNVEQKTLMTKTYNIMTFGSPTKCVFQCYSRFWCFISETVQKSSNQICYNIVTSLITMIRLYFFLVNNTRGVKYGYVLYNKSFKIEETF